MCGRIFARPVRVADGWRGGEGVGERDLAGEDFVGALSKKLEAGGIATADFEDTPAVVIDGVESLHDCGPLHIALPEFDVEPLPEAGIVAFFAAKFFDMKVENAGAEGAEPLFGPARIDDIADVEVPTDPRAPDFIEIARGLEWAEEELVPDIFHGDAALGSFGEGDGLFDEGLGAGVGVGVRDFAIDDSGDEEEAFATEFAGFFEGEFQSVEALFADFGIG